jgi:hypothetical protein
MALMVILERILSILHASWLVRSMKSAVRKRLSSRFVRRQFLKTDFTLKRAKKWERLMWTTLLRCWPLSKEKILWPILRARVTVRDIEIKILLKYPEAREAHVQRHQGPHRLFGWLLALQPEHPHQSRRPVPY